MSSNRRSRNAWRIAFAAGIAFGCLVARPDTARAHRVNAEAVVSDDGGTVRVEAWLSGERTPRQGTVIVLLPDGREYLRGTLDDGVFQFTPDRRERFAFNVQLGEGHAKTFELPEDQFARLRARSATASQTPAKAPTATRSASFTQAHRTAGAAQSDTGWRVLLGLVTIAALVALSVALSTSRRLRELEKRLDRPKEPPDGPASH